MNKLIWTMMVFLYSLGAIAVSQQGRVIEIQDKIKQDISNYIKHFAPGAKHTSQVRITPLQKQKGLEGEDLPFMSYSDDLEEDVWTDPQISLYILYDYIAQAEVIVSIEDSVKVKDKDIFKQDLLREINLVPGRDRVSLEVLSSPVQESPYSYEDLKNIIFIVVALTTASIFILSIFLFFRKIDKTFGDKSSAKKESQSQISGGVPVPLASSRLSSISQTQSSSISGDLSLEDPTKLSEVVGLKIDKLLESGAFPLLKDVVLLEELLQTDLQSFSYLIYELPKEYQEKVYQMGRGEQWFQAYSEVGSPTKQAIHTLDKMLRDRELAARNLAFESLLIHVWRLDSQLEEFILSINRDQAFSILFYLPKNISIPIARSCFPGAWGSIIEEKPIIKISDEKVISKLIEKALSFKPYFDYKSLQTFYNKKDLLSYLDQIEPHVEKDIYAVLGRDNEILKLRPPFFKLFEVSEDQRRSIFEQIDLKDFSLACFNIERQEREAVIQILTEKERYLFGHYLKLFDTGEDSTFGQNDIRREIALKIYEQFEESNQVVKSHLEEVQDSNVA